MSPDPNLPHLERAIDCLGDLADDLMLVGGCAAGLLVSDPGAAPIRPTKDVDLVVEGRAKIVQEVEARPRAARPGQDRGRVP